MNEPHKTELELATLFWHLRQAVIITGELDHPRVVADVVGVRTALLDARRTVEKAQRKWSKLNAPGECELPTAQPRGKVNDVK